MLAVRQDNCISIFVLAGLPQSTVQSQPSDDSRATSDEIVKVRLDCPLTAVSSQYSCRYYKKNKKYVLSNSESVQCNFFIFDHVTFSQFKICCCVQNFIKIAWFLSRVSILTRGQHTDARYWYSKSVDRSSVRLSVCLSVRYVPVSDENGLTYRHIFFTIR